MQPQDLIENESFRRWIFRPTEADSVYWEAWITQHPDHRENAELARQFLLSAKGDLPNLSDQTVTASVGRILAATDTAGNDAAGYRLPKPWWTRWGALTGLAASVLLAVLGGIWLLEKYDRATSDTKTVSQHAAVRMIEIVNEKAEPRLVRLSDGSMVRLQAQARIRFPELFATQKREVYLSGTAFFEVVKNPAKPFLVYANSLTTRVVGTSFTIYASEKDAATRVVVKTGRVAVYPSPSRADLATTSPVVLTPNQQAIYRKGDARPEKAIVEKPEPSMANRFSFRRTPLVRVFETIEQIYGIRVVYNAYALAHCTLTAQLDDQSLFEKLDVITASTGTTYELTADSVIRIQNGSGCQ